MSLVPSLKNTFIKLTMFKIAITGGAGSGKSTVARMFRELGAQVLDADAVAREVVAVGTPVYEELRRRYGPEFFTADGNLDRARLARQVFGDAAERQWLEGLLHPAIAREMRARLAALEAQGTPLVLVEVPLLFEAGLERNYDRIIVVNAPQEARLQRLAARDRRGAEEIAGMLAAQWPLKDKVSRADYVVDNGGDLGATAKQVQRLWEDFQKIILTAPAKKVSVPTNLP